MLQILKHSHKRFWLKTAAAALAAALVVTGCGQGSQNAGGNEQVIATYKDGEQPEGQVTQTDFDSFLGATKFFNPMYAQFESDPSFQDHMVNQFIALEIMGARASEESKQKALTSTDEQMKSIEDYFAAQGNDALESQLEAQAITIDDLRSYMERSILAVTDAESKVTDDQVKANYDEKLQQDPNAFDTATVRHVLVQFEGRTPEEALQRAQEVRQKLQDGGDFAQLAAEYSDDPGSKDNGGRYENAPVSQWVPEFKQAALELPIGDISEPVETAYGYHVMKVESRTTQSFDEAKEQLKMEVAEANMVAFIEQDLPELILSKNLPQPETPAPSEAPADSGAPQTPASPPADAGNGEATGG